MRPGGSSRGCDEASRYGTDCFRASSDIKLSAPEPAHGARLASDRPATPDGATSALSTASGWQSHGVAVYRSLGAELPVHRFRCDDTRGRPATPSAPRNQALRKACRKFAGGSRLNVRFRTFSGKPQRIVRGSGEEPAEALVWTYSLGVW
jgi:hypothetical protein